MKIQKRTKEESLDYIIESAEVNRVANICRPVYENDKFRTWPASLTAHTDPRHREEGGLLIHTAEVLEGARLIGAAYGLDKRVLTVAAIWHDFGKTAEYSRDPDGKFINTPDPDSGKTVRDVMGHPVISALGIAAVATLLEGEPYGSLENITHCILSHHGRIEWGAIKEPQTPEAWALHVADMFSARY